MDTTKELKLTNTRDNPTGSKADRRVTEFTARKVRADLSRKEADGLEITIKDTFVFYAALDKPEQDRVREAYTWFVLSREQATALRDLINRKLDAK